VATGTVIGSGGVGATEAAGAVATSTAAWAAGTFASTRGRGADVAGVQLANAARRNVERRVFAA